MDFDVEAQFRRLPRQLAHCCIEQLAIEFIADGSDVATLLCTEEISCPAYFQIAHRDAEPCAEL